MTISITIKAVSMRKGSLLEVCPCTEETIAGDKGPSTQTVRHPKFALYLAAGEEGTITGNYTGVDANVVPDKGQADKNA